jgi:hypothetical protein
MGSPSNFTASQQLTRVFLKLLDHDAKTKTFHFRTFDDKKDRKRVELIGKLSGTINICEQKLGRRNAIGAGVFVVINEGAKQTRKSRKSEPYSPIPMELHLNLSLEHLLHIS